MLPALLAFVLTAPPPDYTAYYDKGVPFAAFLADATSLVDEWHDAFANASVEEAAVARAKALTHAWRILVVAEDTCRDSLGTVPYVAKLVDASPDTLSMRIVRRAVGLPVMEAHRTPDGRAATPTIVVIAADGSVKGVISERPTALWEYSKEHPDRADRRQWYAEDRGHHAVAELLDMIER